MRKFLAMSLFLSGALVFTSCSEDDAPSDAEVQQAALDQVSAAVDGIVSTDASASGADESVFGWTLTMGGTYNSTATERVDVEGNISADVTWTADKIYEINKRVTVLDGVTLTIEPGTRIEGDVQFTGADASVLMIARGGKIMAEGTAELPIIMTTTDDDGTLTAADKGKWGGLVVLGKAPP